MRTRYFLAGFVAATIFGLLAQSYAAPKVFGISDPGFTSNWPSMAARFQATGASQAGVWVDYCKALSEGGDPQWTPSQPVWSAGKTLTGPPSESVLLTLTGSPSCFPLTPQARQVYADYAAALVKANPNIRELQVWNEPEGSFTAQQYVPLLAATWDAIHKEAPSFDRASAATRGRSLSRFQHGRSFFGHLDSRVGDGHIESSAMLGDERELHVRLGAADYLWRVRDSASHTGLHREGYSTSESESRFDLGAHLNLLASRTVTGGTLARPHAIKGGGAHDYTRLHATSAGTEPLVLGPGAHPDEVVPPYRADLHMSVEDFAREVRRLYQPCKSSEREQKRPHSGVRLGEVDAASYSRSEGLCGRKIPVLDGYAYHPYWNWKPKITRSIARTLDRIWKGTPQTRPCSEERGKATKLVRVQRMLRSSLCGLRFWWTETGAFSSGPQWGRPAMMLGLEGQAQRVYAVAHEAKCNPLVAGAFNYLLTDEQPTHAWTWQSGLYTVTGQPKPALWAFRAGQASRCGKARAVKR